MMKVSVFRSAGPDSSVLFTAPDFYNFEALEAPVYLQYEVAKSSPVTELANAGKWAGPRSLAAITGISHVQYTADCYHNHCFRSGSELFLWEDKDYPILNE